MSGALCRSRFGGLQRLLGGRADDRTESTAFAEPRHTDPSELNPAPRARAAPADREACDHQLLTHVDDLVDRVAGALREDAEYVIQPFAPGCLAAVDFVGARGRS